MLHVFRHFRKNLIESDLVRKYLLYAVGEIILVVAGILIALQVNNWNNRWHDRQREKQFLQQIHTEFEINKQQLEEITAFNQENVDYCSKLINLMPMDPFSVDLDSIGAYIGKSGRWMTFDPSQGSIEALINTSSFDIISNAELRMLLIKWKDLVRAYTEEEKLVMQYLNQIYNPYRDQNFSRNQNDERGYNLKDPRFDPAILGTFEFENQIKRRKTMLMNILVESNRHEVQQVIEDILKLTE